MYQTQPVLIAFVGCYVYSMHYAKLASAGYKGGLGTIPTIGNFCCAKFIQDDTWYRVLVTAVEESDKGLYNVTEDSNIFK